MFYIINLSNSTVINNYQKRLMKLPFFILELRLAGDLEASAIEDALGGLEGFCIFVVHIHKSARTAGQPWIFSQIII
jgi:hypothetical protein